VIVTLNYDLLCEQALWNKEMWTFLDGYGFEKNKESLLGDKKHLYAKLDKSLVKIYKLHGSINWAKDNDQDEFILTDLFFFQDYKGRNTEDDKFSADQKAIVLPNYVNSFIEQKELLKVFCRARDVLSVCEELYIIGYSLSDIDSSVQYMLYDAISRNERLDKSKIYVIDSQPIEHSYEFYEKSVRIKFEKLLDGKFTFINKSLEDWIMGERVIGATPFKIPANP